LQIGILHYEKKNYKKAIAAFEKALSSKNQSLAAEAQYRLAETTQKSRKPSHALVLFRKVIKDFPDQKDWVELAQLKVAENLAAQGNFEEAQKSLQGLSKYSKAADHLMKKIKQKKRGNSPPKP
jgi:TolA-binding protein